MLNSQVTTAQHVERERAYDIVSYIEIYQLLFMYRVHVLGYLFYLFWNIVDCILIEDTISWWGGGKQLSPTKGKQVHRHTMKLDFHVYDSFFLFFLFFIFLSIVFDSYHEQSSIFMSKLRMRLWLFYRWVALMYYLNRTVRKRLCFHGLMCFRKVQVRRHPWHQVNK